MNRTAVNVDDFFRPIVDFVAHEKITQQRLNGIGFVTAREQVQDNYLILRHGNDSAADIIEYRMDPQGDRLDHVGLDKGYLVTFGFALSCNYFSSAFQPESRFAISGIKRLVPAIRMSSRFTQQPGKVTLFVTMTGRKATSVRMLMHGIAWVDKRNFQIIRMRTDLHSPHPENGLDRQTTEVTLNRVQLMEVANPLWLPSDVKVYLR